MPLYTFKCLNDKCAEYDKVVTELLPVNYDVCMACCKCGSTLHRNTVNSVGIAFKGSGFHVNDYPDK